jgi:hypothetical protein
VRKLSKQESVLTRHTLRIALLISLSLPAFAYGRDSDAKLILSGSQTEGSVTGGKTQSYLLQVLDTGTFVFKIDAETAACRTEIAKRSKANAAGDDQSVPGLIYRPSRCRRCLHDLIFPEPHRLGEQDRLQVRALRDHAVKTCPQTRWLTAGIEQFDCPVVKTAIVVVIDHPVKWRAVIADRRK